MYVLQVSDLKKHLNGRNLSNVGKKAELVYRLKEAIQSAGDTPADGDAAMDAEGAAGAKGGGKKSSNIRPSVILLILLICYVHVICFV